MKAKLVDTVDELNEAAELLLQLRPTYSLESILAQIKHQQAQGYNLAITILDDKVVCVAGFVVTEKLAWGKHMYVDDLVTDENTRSKGAGRAMIDWLKSLCRELGCRELHLDSGMQRKDAHRFYYREGMESTGYHFAAPVSSE